jgi:hypothetical protein
MVSKQHGTLHYNASEITAMGSGMGPGSGVVPIGGIIMWSGLLSTIPAGWNLCDGASGRPDLRDKFVKGASNGDNPGGTGGGTTYSHSGVGVSDHSTLSHSDGAVTSGATGISIENHSVSAHADGAVTRGTSGVTVGNHGNHVHSGSSSHSTSANKFGASAGTVVTTATHGNTGNPTAALTHSVTEPNAGAGHDHAFTQPSAHSDLSHSITDNGHEHDFTQPSNHSLSAHSVTQASDHTSVEPPFYALAFIMRTS